MISAGAVEDASDRASWLIQHETRGPGDTLNAMRRLEARYGVSYGLLWALRYRKPKDLLVSAYLSIVAAHEAECERQAKLLEFQRSRTAPQTRLGRALMRTADQLAGAETEAVTGEAE